MNTKIASRAESSFPTLNEDLIVSNMEPRILGSQLITKSISVKHSDLQQYESKEDALNTSSVTPTNGR